MDDACGRRRLLAQRPVGTRRGRQQHALGALAAAGYSAAFADRWLIAHSVAHFAHDENGAAVESLCRAQDPRGGELELPPSELFSVAIREAAVASKAIALERAIAERAALLRERLSKYREMLAKFPGRWMTAPIGATYPR